MSERRADLLWWRVAEDVGAAEPVVPELVPAGAPAEEGAPGAPHHGASEARSPAETAWHSDELRDLPVVAGPPDRRFPRARVTALGVFAVSVASFVVWVLARAEEPPSSRLVVALAHVVGISIVMVSFACLRELGIRSPRRRAALGPWRQFLRGWSALWGAWLVLYLGLSLFGSGVVRGSPALEGAISDVLNLFSACAFFYLFLVLDKRSTPGDDPSGVPRDRDFRRGRALTGAVCIAAGALAVAGRLEFGGLERVGPLVGSLVVAMAMTYFFLALATRGVGRLALAPLVLYVGLQVTWSILVLPGATGAAVGPWISDALLWTALACKAYLFALVTVWVRREALQDFFDRSAEG